KKDEQKKLDLLNQLSGHVAGLRTASHKISSLAGFLSYKAAVSHEGYATISASGSASAGAHTLRIDKLAASDRWAFDAVAAKDVNLASADGQSISFTYDGVAYGVSLSAATSTLEDIAAEISAATGGLLNVSVVNTNTEAAPAWQLVISGKETGSDYRISGLTSTVSGLSIDGTGPDVNGNAVSANNIAVGSNAVALIDGLQVTRNDNDFSGVIEGVSIQATTADPTTTISFTIQADKESVQSTVQAWIDSYNTVISFINGQSQYDSESGPSGPLFGDSALRTVKSTINGVLFGQSASDAANDVEGYGTLKLLGIDAATDGTLSIDAAKFSEKLDANLEAFADLFVDKDGFDNGGAAVGTPGYYTDITADTGLADDLMRAIDAMVKPYNDGQGNSYKGLFDARKQSIDSAIKLFDKQIEEREFRLEKYEAQLVAKFAALESTMARLNAQMAYLQF
ncbi:MAG TPA: flagellar filament capping protein FliD, partial [Planctomycetota bacterium]|nr:flagellar filament capping protein FliD [Planctomycetota bacterium]